MEREEDILQARLAEIELMGDEERAIALEQLTRDYPGLAKQLAGERDFGEEMMMTEMPGMNEGPSGNPFAVQTAANPLEHMAAAGKQIFGNMERKSATDALRKNSADMGAQTMAMMNFTF
jgi:hypothetical protein